MLWQRNVFIHGRKADSTFGYPVFITAFHNSQFSHWVLSHRDFLFNTWKINRISFAVEWSGFCKEKLSVDAKVQGYFASVQWIIWRWIQTIARRTGPIVKFHWRQLNNTEAWNQKDSKLEDKYRIRQAPWSAGWLDVVWFVTQSGGAGEAFAIRTNEHPFDGLKSDNELHPLWMYISHLIVTDKGKNLCWAARGHLIGLAWLGGLGLH